MNKTFSTVSLVLLLAASAPGQDQAPWPTRGWSVSEPEAEGLVAAPLEAVVEDARAGTYGYIDRLLVVRRGLLVLDARIDNDYAEITRDRNPADHVYSYEHPAWHPFYQGTGVHTLQSVTKSVASTLIGIAIGRGEIDGTGAEVLSFFPEHAPADTDGRKQRILLDHLLTMRLGMEWHETDRPIGPTNTTIQLEESDDWFAFTWAQPMEAEPGATWVYNSGGSHLMSGIIHRATGLHVPEFAERHLFGPLGITDYYWKRTPGGFADTEGGLYLRPEDLAKIGYLFLRRGRWEDRQVVPADWVDAATRRIVDDVAPSNERDNRGYGYQWWRLDRDGTVIWAGLGYGGQYLLILPELDLVGVVNSWNVFERYPSILGPFSEALISSARDARR